MALPGVILLTILKILGWVLLAVLVLLIIVLLLPLGIAPCYADGKLSVDLQVAFLHFRLWPRSHKKKPAGKAAKSAKAFKKQKAEKPKKAAPARGTAAEKTSSSAASADKTAENAKAEKSAVTGKPPAEKAEEKPPDDTAKAPPWAGLPFGIPARIDAAVALAKSDPVALAECAFGHLGAFGRALTHCLSVRHLNVWWSITAEDAAATAIRYGATMAALNNLMAILYRNIHIKADHLWLEQDYIGTRKGERHISFTIRSNLALLLWLVLRTLLRLYNEPLFQPGKTAA